MRIKRGASPDRKWPSQCVYYEFHDGVKYNYYFRNKVTAAIHEFERNTCLRFFRRQYGPRIQFTNLGSVCNSELGYQGNVQPINLPSGCQQRGIILHEIGHAIGFWHEQSRSDRDKYITIHWNNIKENRRDQFERRHDVNYQGETYDYQSIMHYGRNYFSKDPNRLDTITVRGDSQVSIGQRSNLSPSDIRQIKKMYKCPSPRYPGILKVEVLNARDLPDTDGWFNNPDPYVSVHAVDQHNTRAKQDTAKIKGTRNPTWNQELDFGESRNGWRFIEISVWDEDWGRDDKLVRTQTFWVTPGSHDCITYCVSTTRCVSFGYSLKVDGNECIPNPCFRGTCRDRFLDYSCNCPPNYVGKNCQFFLLHDRGYQIGSLTRPRFYDSEYQIESEPRFYDRQPELHVSEASFLNNNLPLRRTEGRPIMGKK